MSAPPPWSTGPYGRERVTRASPRRPARGPNRGSRSFYEKRQADEWDQEVSNDMSYYMLGRGGEGELYAMLITLTEEETRRYGQEEGAMTMVSALCVWTRVEALETFRQYLSAIPHDQDSPFYSLGREIHAGTIIAMEFTAEAMRDELRKRQQTGFVLVNPGPEQDVQAIEEFLDRL
jgi:mRNA degradation ribonuclease J1/J2